MRSRPVASFAALVLVLLAAASGAAAQSAAHIHHLAATPHTVAYGYYSAAATPVLRVASGDTVEVETLLTNTPRGLERAGLPSAEVQQSLRNVVDSVTDRGPGGHILTGPIYVTGADSGDVLEVRILDAHLAIPYAYNGCSGFLRENCGDPRTRIIRLDTTRMVASLGDGIVIPLHPFFGSVGVAPPRDSGRVSSNPPSIHGGNMDNKELVAGTTLYLPVWTAGALLEIGDGHAAQGDGEVDQTAIETSLTGRFQLIVRKDMHLGWPMAETPTDYITMGMDKDLTKATQICVQQMVDFLMRKKNLPRVEAYRLASIAANLHITELVDGNVGVHMMIAKTVLGDRSTPHYPALGNGQSGMGNRGKGEWGGRVPIPHDIGVGRRGADCLPDSPFPIADSQGKGGGAWFQSTVTPTVRPPLPPGCPPSAGSSLRTDPATPPTAPTGRAPFRA